MSLAGVGGAQTVWLALGLCLAYLVTRLFNLDVLPMVSDEGTYITWGVRALHAAGVEDWLASLEDGKQPLLAWLMPPFLAMFEDRLIAGRIVSVLAGLANLALIGAVTRRLFDPAAGWLASTMYVIAPIALIHDRMALYDSLVSATSLLTFLAALWWAERPSASRTIGLGVSIGLALLTKLSALFFVALIPLVIWVWRPPALRRWWSLAHAYLIAGALYSVLYVSPIVDNIQEGNFQRYSLTVSEVLKLPISLWLSNATFVALTAGTYLGWPLAVVCAVGLILAGTRGGRSGRSVAIWTLVPLLAFILTAKIIYSRYIVFSLVAAFPAAAWTLVLSGRWLSRRAPARYRIPIAVAAAALIATPAAVFGLGLVTEPERVGWLDDRRWITDRFQYVESNYAGYGLPEVVAFLRGQAQRVPIVVLTRDATGMPRDGVTAYLLEQPNIFVGFIPEREGVKRHLEERPTRGLQLANAGADVYYVSTDAPGGDQERRFRSLNPEMQLMLEVPKPGNHSRFQVYRARYAEKSDDVWLDPSPVFGGQVALRGYNLAGRSTHPVGTLRLILYWEALTRPTKDFSVFNHIVDGAGVLRGQKDGPAGGQMPSSRWRPREMQVDVHQIQVREDAPAGDYELVTGLYELQSLQRLPVAIPETGTSDRVSLGRITVTSALPAG